MSLDAIKPILQADAEAYTKRLMGWPYAGFAPAAEVWARRKYFFAREVWSKRSALCPGVKNERGERITWAVRFTDMWHEPLENYVDRVRRAKALSKQSGKEAA